jgi:hypothetical protein
MKKQSRLEKLEANIGFLVLGGELREFQRWRLEENIKPIPHLSHFDSAPHSRVAQCWCERAHAKS